MQIVSLSSPQKITALAIFIGFVAIILFVVDSSLTPEDSPRAYSWQPPAATTPAPAISARVSEAVPIAKTQLPTKPTATATANPTSELNAKKIDAWSLGGSKSMRPQIALNNVIRDYGVIEINQHPEATPQVGETVSLPMLNGKIILVDVKSTTLNPNGDKSWSGHLQGYGEDYPIIMTYGEHAIFAMITTPEGSYTMESTDGVGWLYKNPSELELSDAGSNDFLEIPHAL